jgi:RimJ/RimL family protein N-acetyltransferase
MALMPAPDLGRAVWPYETDRLALRPATLEDVDAIHAFRNRADVVRHLSHDPMTRDEVVARVADRMARGRPGATQPLVGLAVLDRGDGRVVGDAMLRLEPSLSISRVVTHEWEGTIGYALHPDVHGRGYATEVARALLAIGFDRLGLRRLQADAYVENHASNRVLAKVGMRLEGTRRGHSLGKDGRWLDLNDWAILREEWMA